MRKGDGMVFGLWLGVWDGLWEEGEGKERRKEREEKRGERGGGRERQKNTVSRNEIVISEVCTTTELNFKDKRNNTSLA